ncbi:MAG: GAF domain-containing protein [Acidobacteriota bacterium]
MPLALIALLLTPTTTALLAALAFLIVVVAVFVFTFLRARSRKRKDEARVSEELAAMERQSEFSSAVDQTPYSRTAGEAAKDLAAVLQDHLWLPVLAVYAGREGDATLVNTLQKAGTLTGATDEAHVPPAVQSSLARLYSRPAMAPLDTIVSTDYGTSPDSANAAASQEPAEYGVASLEPATEDAAEIEHQVEPSEHRDAPQRQSTTQSTHRAPRSDVLILPWRGPLDWTGLIVTGPQPGVTLEMLEGYRAPIARLTDRLAAALEIESESEKLLTLDERVSRVVEFSSSLISCLDEPAPLVAIAHEVARLVGADSAALWRLGPDSPMIRMVASYGLRSAEFLPLPLGQGLAGTVAASGELLALENAPSDPRCIFPREARESGIASYLGAAVKSDGTVIAVIEAHTASPHAWQHDQRRSLEAAAAIIAQLVKTTDARGDRLKVESAYLGLSEALQRLRSRDEVLEAAAEVLGHALGISRAVIVELGDEGTVRPVRHEYRLESVNSALGVVFGPSLAERVNAAGSEPVAIGDSREEPLGGAEASAELKILSELALPVRVEGATCAIVYLHQSDRLREWQADEIEFADRVARQLGLSLSNVRALEAASAEAIAARQETGQARETAAGAETLIKRVDHLEREVTLARTAENQTQTMLAHASGLEAKARADADAARRAEAEARREAQRLAAELVRVQNSSQQLLEINRLKSEFIVNAGREIDASLQSVLGLAEMLEQGSYGRLGPEQLEAVRSIYNWGRRVKSDVDWLIEYGSARSRRLEQSAESTGAVTPEQ